jgi:hypothetical protein
VLGGEAVLEGELSIVALANGWVTISVVGGPTDDDKPTVTLVPPSDPDHASSFLSIRVADIGAVYERWSARGAEFLTPPIDRGSEIRCYMRDPSRTSCWSAGGSARPGSPNAGTPFSLQAASWVSERRVGLSRPRREADATGFDRNSDDDGQTALQTLEC